MLLSCHHWSTNSLKLLLMLGVLLQAGVFAQDTELEPINPLQGPYVLESITDGDTFRLEGLDPIRLIGIDTPEKRGGKKLDRDAEETGMDKEAIKALGPQASAFTEALLEGQEVYLEYDAQERDVYRRILAYAYIEDAEGAWGYQDKRYTQVNLAVIVAGWAEPLTIPPNVAYADLYQAAAATARADTQGMWAEMLGEQNVFISCVTFNPPGSDSGNEFVTLESTELLSLDDWKVLDAQGNATYLEGLIEPGYYYDFYVDEGRRFWGNSGDSARLYNAEGKLVDQFDYTGDEEGGTACRE